MSLNPDAIDPHVSDDPLNALPQHLLPLEISSPSLGNSMVMSIGGVDYRVPDPHGDDAATFADESGMTIVSDLDGDGRVDHIATVGFDGAWAAWRPEQDTRSNGEIAHNMGETTPGDHSKVWHVGEWECVDRGVWG